MERMDSAFWEMYFDLVEKVKEKELNDAMETLKTYIIFSSIFNAIVTSFLIDAAAHLEPDPQDSLVNATVIISQQISNASSPVYTLDGSLAEGDFPLAFILFFASFLIMLGSTFLSLLLFHFGGLTRKVRFLSQYHHLNRREQLLYRLISVMPLMHSFSLLLFLIAIIAWTDSMNVTTDTICGVIVFLYMGIYTVVVTLLAFKARRMKNINTKDDDSFIYAPLLIHDIKALKWRIWIDGKLSAFSWVLENTEISVKSYKTLILILEYGRRRANATIRTKSFDDSWYLILSVVGNAHRDRQASGQVESSDRAHLHILAGCLIDQKLPEVDRNGFFGDLRIFRDPPAKKIELDIVIKVNQWAFSDPTGDCIWDEIKASQSKLTKYCSKRISSYTIHRIATLTTHEGRSELSLRYLQFVKEALSGDPSDLYNALSPFKDTIEMSEQALYAVIFDCMRNDPISLDNLSEDNDEVQLIHDVHKRILSYRLAELDRIAEESQAMDTMNAIHRLLYVRATLNTGSAETNGRLVSVLLKTNIDTAVLSRATPYLSTNWLSTLKEFEDASNILSALLSVKERFSTLPSLWHVEGKQLIEINTETPPISAPAPNLLDNLRAFDHLIKRDESDEIADEKSEQTRLAVIKLVAMNLATRSLPSYNSEITEEIREELKSLKDPALLLLASRVAGFVYPKSIADLSEGTRMRSGGKEALNYWLENYPQTDALHDSNDRNLLHECLHSGNAEAIQVVHEASPRNVSLEASASPVRSNF